VRGAPKSNIVSFEQVTLLSETRSAAIAGMDFQLCGGGLVLVHTGTSSHSVLLADACSGLCHPVKGQVQYLGRDWRSLPADRANTVRGTIGWVPHEPVWIANLDMMDNIMLREIHHTRRAFREVRDEAQILAQTFGLPGLPTGDPATLRPADLQRAALVRAFLGSPTLLILENPTRGIYPSIMAALLNAVRKLRESGAAVVWTTVADVIWREQAIRPTLRLQLAGSRLVRVD
jgi:phospholipid/cholesterol/gamma-HCH transport system ATP-binding protein